MDIKPDSSRVVQRRRRRCCGGLIVALSTAMLALCPAPVAGSPAPPTADVIAGPTHPRLARPVVILYGDSLAWEAGQQFIDSFADHPNLLVLERTFGGTAICDYLDQMRVDATNLAPGAVIVEFSGNNFTGCMRDTDGSGLTGQALLHRYTLDARTVAGIFAPHKTQVFFAGSPLPNPSLVTGGYNGGRLNTIYRRLAQTDPAVSYVDAGAALLDNGRWTKTLPCLPEEPCIGGIDGRGRRVNAVRAPDGAHFCPVTDRARQGVVSACATWSSGAYRYAMAMARPILARL